MSKRLKHRVKKRGERHEKVHCSNDCIVCSFPGDDCPDEDSIEKAVGEENQGMGKREYLTKQHRRRIAKAHRGFKHSQATKDKISKITKGHKLTAETKQKMSEAKKGRTFTPEQRQKLSEALKRYNKLNPRGRQ